LAKAARPLKKDRSEALLREVAQRAADVNNDPRYPDYVKALYLFGSVVNHKERPSDVDVAVELRRRYKDSEKYMKACSDRKRYCPYKAVLERIIWHQTEIYRALKRRSTGLSLTEWSNIQPVLKEGEYKIIFEASGFAPPVKSRVSE
jgi:predicted nucleotidyltransferase